VEVVRFRAGLLQAAQDVLAVEAPLEIRLVCDEAGGRSERSIAITMRTPGHDDALALGFLFAEGIVRDMAEVDAITSISPQVVQVTLRPGRAVDLSRLERHSFTTSSCGVCGKSSLESLDLRMTPFDAATGPRITPDLLLSLPSRLRAAQGTFDATGGLHATGLFDARGELLLLREDVGRHNAFDKVVGDSLRSGRTPLDMCVGLLSGRASFELVQKASMAGLRVLAAVGAPSSLAVELAAAQGMTLVGFLREGRFNTYAGSHRIVAPDVTMARGVGR